MKDSEKKSEEHVLRYRVKGVMVKAKTPDQAFSMVQKSNPELFEEDVEGGDIENEKKGVDEKNKKSD